MPDILVKAGLDDTQLSAHSRLVLEHALTASGNPSCLITCFGRSPEHQARAMHDNCLRHGVAEQYRTYTHHPGQPDERRLPGCDVIDVFVADGPRSAEETLADMTAKIIALGPANVSRHCGDQSKLQVIDLDKAQLLKPETLRQVLLAHGSECSLCLDENGCLHVEIPQPTREDT